jgi:hypothetical protein
METNAEQWTPEQALARLQDAFTDAVAVIQAETDGRKAFQDATELANLLRAWGGNAAALRADTALRIAEAEKLSLAGLANRLSVSRGRAQQLTETAKAARSKEEDPDE